MKFDNLGVRRSVSLCRSYTDCTNDVRIYPNPSKDNIIVEGVKNGILEIINLQGKIVKYTPIPDSITRIDISQLTEGIYSLKITTNEGIIVKKLIKQ
ncbi:MAG: T9SS type A sorting domain-containing protein [Paludibacteraceae bacterium]|nr:T9SS type A sorting domain-containing protein [Paludibacteraceae bacterium]MBP8781947.1 T9SS type A sorting domain-containing protein [Paludibacteraceae bacterium]